MTGWRGGRERSPVEEAPSAVPKPAPRNTRPPRGAAPGVIETVGIVGAGKVGTVLARLALAAGFRVLISGSGSPDRIALIVDVLAHGAQPRTTAEVIAGADVVILALPLGKVRTLPAAALGGKLVIDALNYWEPVDGLLPEFAETTRSTSEHVRDDLPGARLVKAFSHLGYHDLDERGRAAGAPDRVALAVAGDDASAVAEVAQLVDALGFDPVEAGPLAAGIAFQAGTPAFGVPMSAAELRQALASVPQRVE
jgi:predicted dinucleotide-binding enzyme